VMSPALRNSFAFICAPVSCVVSCRLPAIAWFNRAVVAWLAEFAVVAAGPAGLRGCLPFFCRWPTAERLTEWGLQRQPTGVPRPAFVVAWSVIPDTPIQRRPARDEDAV
jgi:hypothetical protein